MCVTADETYFKEYVHREMHQRACLPNVRSELDACVRDFLVTGRHVYVC